MALLDKWIALDMGAYLARFYDFSTQKQIVLKTIIAKKGKETLHIEVKGLSGPDIYVHLSPNEYSKMKENDNGNYRLCVVTETLTEPMLWTFLYENGSWFCEENDEITLSLDEEIAAVVYTK